MKPQIAASSWGGRRYPPLVFTEHGAIMAASILNSPRAIEVSVYVVRAFVHLREALLGHKEIGKRLDELERKVGTHDRSHRTDPRRAPAAHRSRLRRQSAGASVFSSEIPSAG